MQGQCLCGAVRIATADTRDIHACHCGTCRNWSSSPAFALFADKPDINGQEHIRHYQSSEWAERAFCATCGTHLYYHLLNSTHYYLYAGLFKEQSFTLQTQIYIDSQAPYATLAADTPKLTEAQFLASLQNAEQP